MNITGINFRDGPPGRKFPYLTGPHFIGAIRGLCTATGAVLVILGLNRRTRRRV